MAVTRLTPATGASVDDGWDLEEPHEGARTLQLVDAAGEIESASPEADRESIAVGAAGGIETEDGWSLAVEPEQAPQPRLEVLDPQYSAVPDPVHDDGWAIAEDGASFLTEKEAAFFAEGESLAERAQAMDTFSDLAEDRGALWDRVRAWWRRR